jgi:hypothetical protein
MERLPCNCISTGCLWKNIGELELLSAEIRVKNSLHPPNTSFITFRFLIAPSNYLFYIFILLNKILLRQRILDPFFTTKEILT